MAVTGASWNSSSHVATLTFTSGPTAAAVGATIVVSGITSSGGGSYDGAFTVTGNSSTTVTYSLSSNPGTFSSAGAFAGAMVNTNDGDGNLVSQKDPRGNTTNYVYDFDDRQLRNPIRRHR